MAMLQQAGLLKKVREDDADGWERFRRAIIFNMHCPEIWESHNKWFDRY